jgi:hypothetical protein
MSTSADNIENPACSLHGNVIIFLTTFKICRVGNVVTLLMRYFVFFVDAEKISPGEKTLSHATDQSGFRDSEFSGIGIVITMVIAHSLGSRTVTSATSQWS